MAETIPQSNIFKFVALRPPTPPSPRNADTGFIRDARVTNETPVGRLVAGLAAGDASKVPELVRRFIVHEHFDLAFPQSDGDRRLDEVDKAVHALPASQISTAHLQGAVENALDQSSKDYLETNDARKQLAGIWDRYYAFLLLGLTEPQNLEVLTRNLRIYHLLRLLAAGENISSSTDLQRILTAQPVVDKVITTLPRPKAAPAEPAPDLDQSTERVQEYKSLWSALVDTHQALREVRALKMTTVAAEKTEDVATPDTCSGREVKTKMTRVELHQAVEPAAFRALTPETKGVLSALRVTDHTFNLPATVASLHTKLDSLNNRVLAVDRQEFLVHMPPQATEFRSLNLLSKGSKESIALFPAIALKRSVRGSIKPLGIGDLKVVKQKLKKYAAGEVAHIENVLRGEYKERKHRVLDRIEETVTTEVETEEETTRDTQSTDRFELKKESEKTIQEQMSVQAGVTVTGSYGTVTFGAHGDFAYSTSTQESSKSSSNFAREVVDKSVSRIQKKTREERIRKTLHEVEEINTHGIDNKDQPDHVTGIYRWVDKFYEAQIYNYGKRMMLEFVVPEPAAFIEYAQTHQPKKNVEQPKPLLKDFTPADLDDWNYLEYIRDYGVQGCASPPPEHKMVSATMASEAKIEPGVPLAKSSKELVVPAGYCLLDVAFSLSVVHATYPTLKFSVGKDLAWYALGNSSFDPRRDGINGSTGDYEGVVPFSINCYDITSFFVQVMATCLRRWETYETWQIQTFEKIVAAYKALQAAYEEKLSAQEVQQGIVIHGQNPRINREIEATELKKHCVKMLLDTWTFGSFDAMKQTNDEVPDFDIFDALQEGKQIQFFEQAFEWENITYLFYPYFWGRQTQWIHKVNTYDTDPLFSKFLQAGAARVLIPVHPSYNDTVMYFLEHGAIWSGGEPPRLNDALFISLADELRNLTDDLGKATPEGEPWEVVLPTTLVYLQKDSDLPTFT